MYILLFLTDHVASPKGCLNFVYCKYPWFEHENFTFFLNEQFLIYIGRGGGPPVISHKCRFISWLISAPRPPVHFLHKTFPATSDKISHCAKFHSSSCLISWLQKSDLCELTEQSPPLVLRNFVSNTQRPLIINFIFRQFIKTSLNNRISCQ